MDITRLKKYLFKLFIMELIVFVLAAFLWFFRRPEETPFYLCLFIMGAIFTGLGANTPFAAEKRVPEAILPENPFRVDLRTVDVVRGDAFHSAPVHGDF